MIIIDLSKQIMLIINIIVIISILVYQFINLNKIHLNEVLLEARALSKISETFWDVNEDMNIDEELKDSTMLDLIPSSSYKKALLQVFGPDDPVEEFWGEMPEYHLENIWYNEETTTENPKKGPQNLGATCSIVKVLGKKVNFRTLENKLKQNWEVNGTMKIMDLVDDVYLVRLSAKEDYMHVLFEGSWKVVDHYIIVQRWQPLFSLSASISH